MHYVQCISFLVTMYEETGILKDFLITKLITKRYMLYFISIHYHTKKKRKRKIIYKTNLSQVIIT